MNFLLVTELFARGGLETQLAGQVRQLARIGHRVHVSCGNTLHGDPFDGAAASLTDGVPLGAAEHLGGFLAAVDALADLIARHEIDVVHAHPFASLLPAWFAAQRCGKPFVLTLHGPLSAQASYGPLHEALLYGVLLPRAAQVICVSDEVRMRVQAHVGADRLMLLPNSVDIERFASSAGLAASADPEASADPPASVDPAASADPRWLVAGRLDEDKMPGVLRFIDVAERAALPGLAIAGDGNAAGRLDDCLAGRQFPHGIERLGHRDDLHRLMPRFAGVAGMGRVVLEAAAANRPVILLGYDGPKGLVDAALFERAARANFSGRGLPAIDAEQLGPSLLALRRSPADFALRPRIVERFAEQTLWPQYASRAADWRFERDPLTGDIDALLRSLHDSELPYLADAAVRAELGRLLLSGQYAGTPAASLLRAAVERDEARTAAQRAQAASAEAGQRQVEQKQLLEALRQTGAERDEQLLQLQRRLADRERELAEAGSREAAQSSRLAELDRSLAESAAGTTSLSEALRQRDEQLLEQQTALAGLRQAVDALHAAVADGQQVASGHEHRIAELLRQLSQRDAQIELLQTYREREQTLQTALARARQEMVDAARAVAEAGQRADHERQRAAESERSAVEDRLRLADGERRVAELEQKAAELELSLARLRSQLSDSEAAAQSARGEAALLFDRIETLMASRSWRLTRPLRVLARIVRYRGLPLRDRDALFGMARSLASRLPLPAGVRTRARSSLLRWLYREPVAFFTETAAGVRGGAAAGASGGASAAGAAGARATAAATAAVAVTATATATAAAAAAAAAATAASAPGPGDGMRASCCGLRPGLVSVVLPVFNQADLLGSSIDSVLAQTYSDFELIVVNDGSTDGVERVLAAYAAHPRVRILEQANQRLPKALSNGFSFASGEFWTWTSADNLMAPQQLEKMVAALRARPELGMVYADYIAIDDRGDLLQDRDWRAHNRPDPASAEIRLPRDTSTLNTVQDNFIGPCFMYRGWIGRVIGDYDPQLGIEDYDYWMRINRLFSIEHLGSSDLLYRYRVHDNSLSSQHVEHRILEKVRELMRYEAERAGFYGRETVFHADPPAADWLRARGVPQASIVAHAGQAAKPQQPALQPQLAGQRKEALLLSAAQAARLRPAALPADLPIAVLFEMGVDDPYELASLLTQRDVLCIAHDPRTAARIRLIRGDCPVIDGAAPQAVQAVSAFAAARGYLQRTRGESELARVLPEDLPGDRRRNVLLQVDSFTQGGLENVVIDVARSLLASGCAPRILVLGKAGEAADKARRAGLDVHVRENGLSPAEYRQLLRETVVELVNAHYSTFGAEVAALLDIPFVQTIHNSYVWFDPAMIETYRAAERYTSAYICVSRSAARYADMVLGLDVQRMKVIPNGVDTQALARHTGSPAARGALRQAWGAGDGEPVFLNVASIMAPKAQLPLVNAFSRVHRERPGARLVLLGATMEPQYAALVEKRIRELGLQDSVVMAGFRREVGDFYEAADVFVLPSFWEGWSLSLGEALYLGLPVVATDVGAAGEFSDVANIEIVGMPFGRSIDLNYLNLGRILYERGPHDARFEGELADAMLRAARRRRLEPDAAFLGRLDAARAYRSYRRVFSQVCAAGAAPAARESV
ncbi:MAG: glycosyltransferase [Burkholderiaceae bacterium]